MAEGGSEGVDRFCYREVELFRDEVLGTGSYGTVCKAMCDELPCAAKVIHSTFFQFNDPASLELLSRFERECRMLSAIRHPCIVQCLCMYNDPHMNLPVLLMELMDESLTKYLEKQEAPVPYHLQLGICHDIALALSYLHSNSILHRDLSSNNVLLIAGSRAKVTDFGMSKLVDVNPRMTPLTQCPGTLVYMAPEALRSVATYSEKLDIFSAGVLIIQVITRAFPTPGPAKRVVEDPRYPGGNVEVAIPERERRKDNIDLVEPAHPLLPVAIDCLSDREVLRPSAPELCRLFTELKLRPDYNESVVQMQERIASIEQLEENLEAKEAELEALRQELGQKDKMIEELRDFYAAERQHVLLEKDDEIEALRNDLEKANEEIHRLQVEDHRLMDSLPLRWDSSSRGSGSDIEVDDDIEKSVQAEEQLSLEAPSSDIWFHGRISRSIACQRLEGGGRAGAYLIRESESAKGNFVLSFMDSETRVHHFKISCKRGRYNIGGSIWFSSLQNLVGYHMKYSSVVEKHSERLEIPIPPPKGEYEQNYKMRENDY